MVSGSTSKAAQMWTKMDVSGRVRDGLRVLSWAMMNSAAFGSKRKKLRLTQSQHGGDKLTKEVQHRQLVEAVARRMLSDMEDHGGVDEFCGKLQSYPEQYLSELALGALDCVALSDCLHPRVIL
jgi:hypothetical protein